MSETRHRLDSWKSIAEYLGRDVRTAIRWEKDRGMPVHRVPGGSRHAVLAYAEEIDAWLDTPTNQPAVAASEASATRLQTAPKRSGLWAITGIAVAATLAATAFTIYSWKPAAPQRFSFGDQALQAWDEEGELVWEFGFPHRLSRSFLQNHAGRLRMMDANGDGAHDMMVVWAEFENPGNGLPSHEVFCLTAAGKHLWRYVPELTLSAGSQEFRGPWHISGLTISPHNDAVWVAVHHPTFWPSYLVRIDQGGRPEVRFFNSGWILEVAAGDRPSGCYVFACGISNEHNAGILAVVREDAPASVSPHLAESAYVLEREPLEHLHIRPRANGRYKPVDSGRTFSPPKHQYAKTPRARRPF